MHIHVWMSISVQVCWLVGFYGTPTLIGNLMPNSVFICFVNSL